jgi:acetyl-CoA acyltransferase
MKNVVIIDAKRTAIGKAKKGSLKDTRPDDFASSLLKSMLAKSKINVDDIDDLIIGCAMPEGEQGMNVARTIGILANVPYNVPALTVNRFCASGLQAINNIAQAIAANSINLGIAGGVESMSMVPMGGYRFQANNNIVEKNINFYTSMGMTAENVASLYNITREKQDIFSVASHEKSLAAREKGYFNNEIETIDTDVFRGHKKDILQFSIDDGPRKTSIEQLAKLKPCFKKNGTVTAGNSSQISDGAAFCTISNEEYADQHNLNKTAYFRECVVVGVPPHIMGVGPVDAINKLLKKCNLNIKDIGLFEINEAFAAQAVYCIEKLNIDPNIVNVNGGAIALGHPLGCTGGKLTVQLINEMKRRNQKYGMVSMCVGAGQGAAGVFQIL